jgi:hypothetical protein
MTSLLTGLLLGAASWGLLSDVLAPAIGWPLLIVGMFLLFLAWVALMVQPEPAS